MPRGLGLSLSPISKNLLVVCAGQEHNRHRVNYRKITYQGVICDRSIVARQDSHQCANSQSVLVNEACFISIVHNGRNTFNVFVGQLSPNSRHDPHAKFIRFEIKHHWSNLLLAGTRRRGTGSSCHHLQSQRRLTNGVQSTIVLPQYLQRCVTATIKYRQLMDEGGIKQGDLPNLTIERDGLIQKALRRSASIDLDKRDVAKLQQDGVQGRISTH